MRKKRSRRILQIFVFLFLIVCSVDAYKVYLSSLPLMSRAMKVMDVNPTFSEFCSWISDHEFIAEHGDANTAGEFARVDIVRKQITTLTALNQLVAASKLPRNTTCVKSFSPDAKWLMVGNFFKGEDGTSSPKDNDPIRRKIEIFALDGSRTISFSKVNNSSAIVWLFDSMRWAEINTGSIAIHSIDNPTVVNHVPIVYQATNNSLEGALDTVGDFVLTSNDHFISNLENAYDNSLTEVNLFDADLRSNPVKATPVILKLPVDVHTELVAASPDGKWIAWKWFAYRTNSSSPLVAWLQKFLPYIKNAPSTPRTELWISKIDGSGMKLVGYMAESFQGSPPYSLSWSLDSKRLYFNAGGDTMWMIPAGN